MTTVHTFASSREAYDASQTHDDIRDGDLLIVPDERAVAVMVQAWPTALDREHAGTSFHVAADGLDWAHVQPLDPDDGPRDYSRAVEIARRWIRQTDGIVANVALHGDGWPREHRDLAERLVGESIAADIREQEFPNLEPKPVGCYVRTVHPSNVGRMPDGVVEQGSDDGTGEVFVRVGSGSTVYGPARNWKPIDATPGWLAREEIERYYADPAVRAAMPCSECGSTGGCEHFPEEIEVPYDADRPPGTSGSWGER